MQFLIFILLFISGQYLNNKPIVVKKSCGINNVVFQSSDEGTTWDDISTGLPPKFDPWSVYAESGEVMIGHKAGIYRTTTSTAKPNWRQELLLNESINTIFNGKAGPYAGCYDKGFYQKLSATGVWIPVYSTLPEKTVRTVLETKKGEILIGCDSGIFKSMDNGKTWKKVFEGAMVTNLAAKDNAILCGSYKGVFRSVDGGDHWQNVLTEDGPTHRLEIIDGQFVAISYGMKSLKNIAENTESVSYTIRNSVDGGKTWGHYYKNLFEKRYFFKMEENQSDILIINDIKQSEKYIFCSTDSGVFRSIDRGKSWELVLPSTPNTLYEIATSGRMIYAIKVSRGC
ncbi:MAG: hypothetical protein IPM42_06285 [Saprospiraceae bacterium]|nr:hypothetical protein [Saprospiraceae bacterium]